MASNTENLNLLKKNPATDGADTFNIQTMLNENWDKIDEAAGTFQKKIETPTAGNFAGIDANGNVTDSGKKESDFRPSTWTPTLEDIGAEESGAADVAVSTHNKAANPHTARFAAKQNKITALNVLCGYGNGDIRAAADNDLLLSDGTVQALGLEETASARDAFRKLAKLIWRKIAEYTTAGAYTWTAPDLNNGQPYQIGVWMCGGGGAGGFGLYGNSDTTGGASGYDVNIIVTVTPGQTYPLVVGAGGAAETSTNNTSGQNGGTTSAFGISVNGGTAGGYNTSYISGGQPVRPYGNGQMGGKYGGMSIGNGGDAYPCLSACYNQFSGERKLGSGGSAYGNSESAVQLGPGGKGPSGLGGGDAAHGTGAKAEDATEYGCGGGAVIRQNLKSATNGAGADGAIFIYFGGAA